MDKRPSTDRRSKPRVTSQRSSSNSSTGSSRGFGSGSSTGKGVGKNTGSTRGSNSSPGSPRSSGSGSTRSSNPNPNFGSRTSSRAASGAGASKNKQVSITQDGQVKGSNRDIYLFIFFCVLAFTLLVRLISLQVIEAPALSEMAKDQRTTKIALPAKRGVIYDRNYNVLAMSVDATTIYANPSEVKDPKATSEVLTQVLGGVPEDYYSKLCEDTTFVYIKQKADTALAQQLMDKEEELHDTLAAETYKKDAYATVPNTALFGIYYLHDTRRDYPYGSVGMQVIGMVDPDNNGVFGMEQMYDSVLRGKDGEVYTEYSRQSEGRPLSGQPIPGSERVEVEAVNGNDIVISIDIELQQYLEDEMTKVGDERETKNGNALVLDGASGEIYATASLPLPTRGNLSEEDIANGATTLKSICWGYEPGSIFKLMTAAAVVGENAIDPNKVMYVPFTRQYQDYQIKDAHEHETDMMNFYTIIAESSNVGTTMAKDNISNDVYADYLAKFGVNKPTHVDYPGESTGILDDYNTWSDIKTANIAFGQGVSVTSLQMASFYGAIANDGLMYQPHFLIDRPQSLNGRPYEGDYEVVMDTGSTQTLDEMLKLVVSDGTGTRAAIEGYNVAGKTGTAEIPSDDGGYVPGEYIVSFVGYLADSNSKLVCITSMDNPIGAEGNAPTGPLFATIMKFAANRYMIEPTVDIQNSE